MSAEKEQLLRLEHLYELRRGLLDEMEEADRELSRVRLKVERAESDLRNGDPGPPNYEELRVRHLPQAECRYMETTGAVEHFDENRDCTVERPSDPRCQ